MTYNSGKGRGISDAGKEGRCCNWAFCFLSAARRSACWDPVMADKQESLFILMDVDDDG